MGWLEDGVNCGPLDLNALSVGSASKLFRMIYLCDVHSQPIWSDILAKNRGVGGFKQHFKFARPERQFYTTLVESAHANSLDLNWL